MLSTSVLRGTKPKSTMMPGCRRLCMLVQATCNCASGQAVSINRLSTEQRARIVGSLVEGNSIRATVRMTGAAKNTVTKLLVDLGAACAEYQDRVLRDLDCKTIECD